MSNTIWGDKRKPFKPEPPIELNNEVQPKKRKKRSDAKRNIKFPLQHKDKRDLEWKALEHNLKITPFASMIAEEEISSNHNFGQYEYDDSGELINLWLSESAFKEIQRLRVEWNASSYREVAFRVVKGYLERVMPQKLNITVYDRRDNHEI